MRIYAIIILILLALVAGFTALNWSEFMVHHTISFGITTLEAPLGLLLLGIIAALTLVFFVFVIYLQSTVLLETRRHAKDIAASRQLADQAEASRFTELRQLLVQEVHTLSNREQELHTELLERLQQMEARLKLGTEEAGNSLAVYIGELEDRLQRPTP